MVHADIDLRVSNTNYLISQGSLLRGDDERHLYDYDRLRLRADYSDARFFATVIADGVNHLGHSYVSSPTFEYVRSLEADIPFGTQTGHYEYGEGDLYAKLYRLYGGYEDEKHRIVVGLQNITMGVGRIWEPTNLFNPRNTYALEPDEVFPVAAISYTRHLDELSDLSVVVSQKADHSFKYAGRYKAYLAFADMALDIVSSDETTMIGYELEGDLGESGVEVRSEGAYIKNELSTGLDVWEDVEFFQGIVGADYGFENGLTVVLEALYSTQTFTYEELLRNIDSEILPNLVNTHFYAGMALSYSFSLFLDGSLGYIESFADKHSRFITPTLTYTLDDHNSFAVGAMLYSGKDESEFGHSSDTYYLNYTLAF